MKKRKLITAFSTISTISLPLATLSCGRDVKTAAKIEQENKLSDKANADIVEQNWTQATLFFLYNIQSSSNNYSDYENAYIKEFNDKNSQLFKDSYKAFETYAKNKLKNDTSYFANQNTSWIGSSYFNPTQLNKLPEILSLNTVPSEDIFSIWWNASQTKIREEIEKMLFVKFYFAIKDKDNLKKIDDSFKYTASNLKYELDNYLLIKYALDKKYVQLWQKVDSNSSDKDDFFIHGFNLVQGNNEDEVAQSFNSFMTGTDVNKKFDKQSELLVNYPNVSILDKLDGYQGFKSAPSDVKLDWDYDNLVSKKANQTYGFYDPNQEILINPDNTLLKNGYNPYKSDAATNNVPEIVYLNQITPIGATNETSLPISEDEKNTQTKNVKLLTFKGTIYENYLDNLAYMFYTLDNSLYTKATDAFAKLGYKLSFNKDGQSVKDSVKDKPFVQN